MNRVEEDLRPEYTRESLGKGVIGKYHAAYQEGVTFMVGLEPDVAKVFPDATAVNQALRTLIRLMAAKESPLVDRQQEAA